MIEKTERDFFINAIFSIKPNSQFIVGDTYSSLDWHSKDQVKPTESEFNEALKTVKSNWTAQDYARNRESDYPSIGDQLDMMYKDTKNSTTTHAAAVEAVKTKWPKDNSGPV